MFLRALGTPCQAGSSGCRARIGGELPIPALAASLSDVAGDAALLALLVLVHAASLGDVAGDTALVALLVLVHFSTGISSVAEFPAGKARAGGLAPVVILVILTILAVLAMVDIAVENDVVNRPQCLELNIQPRVEDKASG